MCFYVNIYVAIENITSRLFYKQFPYKIVLKRGPNTKRRIEHDLIKSKQTWHRVKVWGEPADRWYLSTKEQRDNIACRFTRFVIEMSSPHSEGHLQALIEGDNAIVRDRKFFSTYKYAVKFGLNCGWEPSGDKFNWLLKTICEQGMCSGQDYELRRRVHLFLYTNSDDLVMILKLKYIDCILDLITVKHFSEFE